MPQPATAFALSNSSRHPAFTCLACRDGFLRMWDLVKGRCTYTVRLEAEAEAVHFCQEDGGARYALLCGTLLTLHSVGEAGTLRTLAHPRRALCMAWAPGGRIVSGSEDGSLRLWDTQVCGCCFALAASLCSCSRLCCDKGVWLTGVCRCDAAAAAGRRSCVCSCVCCLLAAASALACHLWAGPCMPALVRCTHPQPQ